MMASYCVTNISVTEAMLHAAYKVINTCTHLARLIHYETVSVVRIIRVYMRSVLSSGLSNNCGLLCDPDNTPLSP
jgi:hypothetical protein